MRALASVLSLPTEITPIESMEAWWARHQVATAGYALPIEEAIVGGFAADRLGYAFVSGYEAALRALVPDLPRGEVTSLCVTERGGAHPAAIEARLTPLAAGGFQLTGQKRWATFPGERGLLLVAASEGRDAQGRSLLRVARVASTAPGVSVFWMDETPFMPEIAHAEVRFEGAHVSEDAILPGDGYLRYIKPFRTIEDIHVHAAVLGYLLRETRAMGFARALEERLSAEIAALYSLAAADPNAPEVHIALSGALRGVKALIHEIEVVWARTESPSHARWERDKLLFSVADSARNKRLERAWIRLNRPAG